MRAYQKSLRSTGTGYKKTMTELVSPNWKYYTKINCFSRHPKCLKGFQIPFIYTVILVVVNYNSSHSCPGADWQKHGRHSANIHHLKHTAVIHIHTRREVSCPRTQWPWHNWPGGHRTADPPNIGRPTLPPEPQSLCFLCGQVCPEKLAKNIDNKRNVQVLWKRQIRIRKLQLLVTVTFT